MPAVIVDSAIYVDGKRAVEPGSLEEIYDACRSREGIAWIGLYKPTAEEFESVAEEFELHPLAVEDALDAHQRPKLERYGETLFVVLRPARYVDKTETVEFGETHVFVGKEFVITVRHSEVPDLGEVRRRLEEDPELLRRGPEAILHAIMDQVVDDYGPVADGLENDIEEIEAQVFGGSADVSRRVYDLSREVIAFQRATRPLGPMLERLLSDRDNGDDERMHLGDVQDHALRVVEQADALRELLQNILNVNLTLETKALTEASNAQNEEVKMISAWAAILYAPTLVGTVYGMNFDGIPELEWRFGYAYAVVLMLATSVTLYLVFKHRRWI
jgi:magnesium transporter